LASLLAKNTNKRFVAQQKKLVVSSGCKCSIEDHQAHIGLDLAWSGLLVKRASLARLVKKTSIKICSTRQQLELLNVCVYIYVCERDSNLNIFGTQKL
jgi:hypothetical protein